MTAYFPSEGPNVKIGMALFANNGYFLSQGSPLNSLQSVLNGKQAKKSPGTCAESEKYS